MPKIFTVIISFFTMLMISSCSKKNHPSRTPETAETNNAVAPPASDSLAAKKVVFRPRRKDIIPKTIMVNDNAARKSVDGRLYYDLLGHRYWKNYKDGKYYLFNQSMYANDSFKPK